MSRKRPIEAWESASDVGLRNPMSLGDQESVGNVENLDHSDFSREQDNLL